MAAPNAYQTGPDFMFAFVQSYLFQGNTYCFARRNRRNEIQEMHVLNPYRVKPLIAQDGSIFYECGEDFLAGLAPNTIVPERDMIHHRLPLLPGYPLVGVTPIFAAAASSAVGLKILQNSQQFFSNASRPSGMLTSESGRISPEAAARFKQEWDEAYRGEGMGKIAVMHSGLKFEPLTITAQDAQLIEQLRWSVEDVARVFRVPPFMLGDMTKVSYRNTEQLGARLHHRVPGLPHRPHRAAFPACLRVWSRLRVQARPVGDAAHRDRRPIRRLSRGAERGLAVDQRSARPGRAGAGEGR